MSLKVWLPGTIDFSDSGVYETKWINHGVTIANNGKLGNCFNFNGSSNYLIDNTQIFSNTSWSISVWIYTNNSNTQGIVCTRLGVGTGISVFLVSGVLRIDCGGNSTNCQWVTSYTIPVNTWFHLCIVSDGTLIKYYINGSKRDQHTFSSNVSAYSIYTTIGASHSNGTGFGNYLNGRLNDVRIYDTALDENQIKKISMGLVAHYPLSDLYNSQNLIFNGYGEYGSDGWNNTTISTSDLPSGNSSIKSVFTNGSTSGMIPVNVKDTFTMSCYIKSTGATSEYVYPSIFPYDIDKKFINNYNCPDGFSTSWQATLTQPLNKGDTVVHCSDLSAWSTATNNYYYRLAIFSYKDSFGNVYPDFTYTADVPSFGSYSDKSKINKSNNTITLLSPYTGEPRAAGTRVCQATEGSTYFYPFGGITLASVQDWTFKTATFSFKDKNRLRYAKYIQWYNYPGIKYAGIKISNDSSGSNIVYDVSGYNRNGIETGTFNMTNNSTKYKYSTTFNGSSYITFNPLPSEAKTVSCWVKHTLSTTNSVIFADYATGLALGFHSNNALIVHCGTSNGSTGSRVLLGGYYNNSDWNHIVIVKTGTGTYTVYLNGHVLNAESANYWTHSTNDFMIGRRSAGTYYSGYLSDFRVYSTALSADDVTKLYKGEI